MIGLYDCGLLFVSGFNIMFSFNEMGTNSYYAETLYVYHQWRKQYNKLRALKFGLYGQFVKNVDLLHVFNVMLQQTLFSHFLGTKWFCYRFQQYIPCYVLQFAL